MRSTGVWSDSLEVMGVSEAGSTTSWRDGLWEGLAGWTAVTQIDVHELERLTFLGWLRRTTHRIFRPQSRASLLVEGANSGRARGRPTRRPRGLRSRMSSAAQALALGRDAHAAS